jgi:hypothetical protein
MLVEDADASHESEQKPEAGAAAVHYFQNDGGAEHPENRFEGVHREEVIKGEIDRGEEDEQCCEKL